MLIMGGSGNNRGAVLGGLMLWVIWSGTELVIRFGANVLGDVFPDLSASVLVTKASFLRLFLIGLILQFVLQRFPKGILPEVRPAALGGKTNEVRD
jgi:branched-chain amino acid transport system permease protein